MFVGANTRVDWVPGFSRGWWVTGFEAILFGGIGVGSFVTYLLGLDSRGQFAGWGLLVYVGVASPIVIFGLVAYPYLMPSTARLGVMSEGIIVEAGSPKYPWSGFQQAYRWGDAKLQGNLLTLPWVRSKIPRSIRLRRAQADRVRAELLLHRTHLDAPETPKLTRI